MREIVGGHARLQAEDAVAGFPSTSWGMAAREAPGGWMSRDPANPGLAITFGGEITQSHGVRTRLSPGPCLPLAARQAAFLARRSPFSRSLLLCRSKAPPLTLPNVDRTVTAQWS
jgi:hypothetical protein